MDTRVLIGLRSPAFRLMLQALDVPTPKLSTMNAESIEHYPGYSVLVSYLKHHNTWSYSEFLKLHRDTIVSSPPFADEWNGLDGAWSKRFLREVKVLNPLNLKVLEKKSLVLLLPGCQDANNLDHYAKQLAVKCTHIIGSLDLLDKAGKHNTKDLSKDFSNPFLVSTTIAKNSVEEDAGGEGKMSDQDYEEEDGLDGDKTCQLRKKITTMDSTEDLDEDENVPAVVLGDTDGDKIVDAVCIKTNGKFIDGWMLPDGRNVGELFTKYRATVKERDIFAASHIFDLADVALVHHARSLSDDDELWSEIEDAWDAKWGNYRPSEHVSI
ncbi:hypothetical protein BC936DRAFT_137648 [Jimgerdemannia flammicorona]|uniref:Uncharacterized protein n=1 Tax=Jimgerdemannia flammicorona TaxID=994334 RepID=A0A433CWX6_9FUNG|nr:hypothetical protein BC936DRAFT_137648 [Jimgerdemannia flammicorona]